MICVDPAAASTEFRELERLREKASHDEAQALHHAEQKGLEKGRTDTQAEIAQNLFALGLTVEQIERATSLSAAEIEELRRQP